ncbi:MAG: cyanophycinase [Planctomycetes bacterium]|nr:cyanophycinase [Planctomycetota bacterium]
MKCFVFGSRSGAGAVRVNARQVGFAVLAGVTILFAYSTTVLAQESLLGMPTSAATQSGLLVIVGGGNLPEEADNAFYQHAGGAHSRLVLIPSAYPFSSREGMESYYSAWSGADCETFDFLDASTREEADSDEFVKPLLKATGVWIGGGVQGRLSDLYTGTKVEAALKGVLERGGVVGGTSAGAAILSQTMIRQGSQEVVVGRGFSMLKNAVIDQHFSQRRRQGRLNKVISDHSPLIGLGIDESTALLVQGDEVRVVGEGEVTVCVSNKKKQVEWTRKLESGAKARFKPVKQQAEPSPVDVELIVAKAGEEGGGARD